MQMRHEKVMSIWMGVAVILLLISFWQQRGVHVKKYSETRILFGSFVDIDICSQNYSDAFVRQVVAKVWRRLDDLNARLNAYDSNSDVYAINNSGGEKIKIKPDLYSLLRLSVTLSNQTDGAFDITVRPLVELWEEYGKKGEFPSSKQIHLAKSVVGSKQIEFYPETTIRLNGPAVKIDLSAIAEGYALDEAARILRNEGVQDFCLNIGGDVYASGNNCEGDQWRIGIRDPQNASKIVDIVRVSNAVTTTSGSYEKFYEVNGKKYSHIINPLTGYPSSRILSATVLAPSGIEADAFSTAICAMGEAKALQFINKKNKEYAALIVTNSPTGKVAYRQSKKLLNYLVPPNQKAAGVSVGEWGVSALGMPAKNGAK